MLVSRPFSLPSVRRGTALAAVVIAASALAGCASADETATKQTKSLSGDAGEAQAVVADLAKRASKKTPDSTGICAKDLSVKAQAVFAKLGGGNCPAGVSKVLSQTDYLPLNVNAVSLNTGAAPVLPEAGTTPSGTTPTKTTPAKTTPSGTTPTGTQWAVAQVDTPNDIGTRSVILTRATSKDTWKIDSFNAKLTPKSKTK